MRVFGQVQQRAARFWQENLPCCVAFFFFLALGAACGYASCRGLFGDALLQGAEALFSKGETPRFLPVLCFAVLTELAWISCILFTGLQRCTVPVWMLCVALRGFALGAAVALCALVGQPLLWAAFLVPQAPLQLAALRLAAFSIRNLRGRGSSRRARPPLSPEAYLAEGVRLGMTLLLLAVLEGTLLPLLLYVLLRAG